MAFNPADWGQGRLLTGLIPGSSLSGYTALITKDNLPTSALDGGVLSALPDGGDWRFSTTQDGQNQLPCDVIATVTSGTPSNTALEIEIRFATYATGFREVYAFWNSAGKTQPAVGAAFGRDETQQDFEAVYHLNDLIDSAGTYDLTNADGAVLQSGGGYEFTGTQRLVFPTALARTLGSDFTISLVFLNNGALSDGHFLDTRQGGGSGIDLSYRLSELGGEVGSTAGDTNLNGTTYPTGSSTYYADYIRDTDVVSLYVDGQTPLTTSVVGTSEGNTTTNSIGNQFNNADPLGAGRVLYSVCIKSTAETVDFRDSKYSNRSNPATFWTLGAVFVPAGDGVTASSDITVTAPTFAASAAATLPQPSAASAVTIPAPLFSSSASATLPQPSAGVTVTIPAPLFSASASATLPNPTAVADVTIAAPIFAATAEPTLPNPTASVDFTISGPVFAATASATVTGNVANADITAPAPTFAASASVTLPQPSASSTITIPGPIFAAVAFVTGNVIITYTETNIDLPALSTNITLPDLSTNINI
jgi:hypothetical protein